MKIFKKFLLYFLFPLVGLLMVIGIVTNYQTASSLQVQADDNLQALADTINFEITESIKDIKSDLTVMSTYREFDRYYNYLDFGQINQADREATAIQDNLVNLAKIKGGYTAMRLYNVDGSVVLSVIDGKRSYTAVDVSDTEWFSRTLTMKEGESVVSKVYTSPEYTGALLTISQPIYYRGED